MLQTTEDVEWGSIGSGGRFCVIGGELSETLGQTVIQLLADAGSEGVAGVQYAFIVAAVNLDHDARPRGNFQARSLLCLKYHLGYLVTSVDGVAGGTTKDTALVTTALAAPRLRFGLGCQAGDCRGYLIDIALGSPLLKHEIGRMGQGRDGLQILGLRSPSLTIKKLI